MNRFYNFIIGCSFVLIASSCNESLEYKYNDKPMQVSCSGANEKLLNEALYSFFDDITVYYRTKSNDPSEAGMSTYEAYANYIYQGALGDADYKSIVSEHTKNVMNELRKETQLWDKKPAMSNLNYNSEFVNCLINKIKDKDMVTTIKALNTANKEEWNKIILNKPYTGYYQSDRFQSTNNENKVISLLDLLSKKEGLTMGSLKKTSFSNWLLFLGSKKTG